MKSLPAGALVACLFTAPAFAASMPANCSAGAVPPGLAKGEIAHKPFVPTQTTFRVGQTNTMDGVSYDDLDLKLSKPEGGFDEAEADVTVMVKRGQKPDGRTFRQVPGDIEKQPQAANGWPEIQGWTMSDDASGARLDSVLAHTSSLQVTFGQRKGDTIAGTLYLCEPSQGSGWVAGSFTATIEKNQ